MILLTSFIFNFAKVGFHQGIQYFHIILENVIVLKMQLKILENKQETYKAAHDCQNRLQIHFLLNENQSVSSVL